MDVNWGYLRSIQVETTCLSVYAYSFPSIVTEAVTGSNGSFLFDMKRRSITLILATQSSDFCSRNPENE